MKSQIKGKRREFKIMKRLDGYNGKNAGIKENKQNPTMSGIPFVKRIYFASFSCKWCNANIDDFVPE